MRDKLPLAYYSLSSAPWSTETHRYVLHGNLDKNSDGLMLKWHTPIVHVVQLRSLYTRPDHLYAINVTPRQMCLHFSYSRHSCRTKMISAVEESLNSVLIKGKSWWNLHGNKNRRRLLLCNVEHITNHIPNNFFPHLIGHVITYSCWDQN